MTQPLSRELLLKRGRCCHLGCVNCPYNEQPEGLTNEPEDGKLKNGDQTSDNKENQ